MPNADSLRLESRPEQSYLYSVPFLLLVTVVGGLVGELAYVAIREWGLRDVLPTMFTVALPAILSGAMLPYLLIRFVYRSSLRDFGVRWLSPGRRAASWLIGSSALALVVWFGSWGLLYVAFRLAPPDAMPMTLAEFHAKNPLYMLLHGESGARVLPHILHMMIVVGFAEELFGRGLLQNALDRRYLGVIGRGRCSIRTSTLLAALLFAFWHTEWISLNSASILGSIATSMTIVLIPSLLLCVVYEKTRSMLVVIVLHNVIDGGKLITWYLWSVIIPG